MPIDNTHSLSRRTADAIVHKIEHLFRRQQPKLFVRLAWWWRQQEDTEQRGAKKEVEEKLSAPSAKEEEEHNEKCRQSAGDGGESKYQQMKTSEGEPPQIAALPRSTTIKNAAKSASYMIPRREQERLVSAVLDSHTVSDQKTHSLSEGC